MYYHFYLLYQFLINFSRRISLRSAKTLRKSGIPAIVILDTAVGYVIGKVDAVFVGAEGVVESGGLINAVSGLSFRALCGRTLVMN